MLRLSENLSLQADLLTWNQRSAWMKDEEDDIQDGDALDSADDMDEDSISAFLC